MKTFKQILSESSDANHVTFTDRKAYDEHIKKHHPDAKEIHNSVADHISQHVVGARETVVGHWDHKSGTGRAKK